jgi:GNAT superfamily N-acetyltransferase
MTTGDADAVAALTGELGYPATPADIIRRFARIDGRPDQIALVAEDGGVPVGWIHVARHPYLESDSTAEILGLVVGDGHRSRGVGRLLVEAGERWARGAGCAALRVRSRVTRDRAHAFYERQGFRRIKTQHAFEKPLT